MEGGPEIPLCLEGAAEPGRGTWDAEGCGMQRDVGCSGMQWDGGTPLPDTPTAPEPHSYGVTVCGAAAGALCMDGFGVFLLFFFPHQSTESLW